MKLHPVGGLVAMISMAAAPAWAFDGWHLERATVLPGAAVGWDYVSYDAATAHVFIGHRQAGLMVYDPAADKLVAVIDHTASGSSNGATLLPEFDLGVSNNGDGTITPFKLSTLEAKPSIKLSDELDTSHYDAGSKRLVVNNAAGKDGTTLTILAVPSLETVGTIKVATKKAEGADADGKGDFFLAAQDMDRLLRIDTKAMKVLDSWEIAGCARPTGVAADPADGRVFVSCRGNEHVKPSLAVLDGTSGKVVFTGEIGGGTDSVIYDPGLKRVFSANGINANLAVFEQVDADHYRAVEALGTRAGVRTMAMDHQHQKIYAVTEEGTTDYTKKVLTAVSPYYANTYFPGTFTVLTYGR